jgi:hypothetical protein
MRCAALLTLVLFLVPAFAEDKATKPVTPAEAAKMVDKKVTVEMEVKSAGKGRGVFFLNSEEDYRSDRNFTGFINQDGAKKFQEAKIDDPSAHFKGKTVRITGTVKLYREKPEIVIEDPKQVEIVRKDQDSPKQWPKGSEKAVAALQKEFPKAVIDEVAEPKGFGGSGGKGTPLSWNVRFHVGDKPQELSLTPQGTIIRLPTAVAVGDLPKAVADAVAKAEPKAAIRSAQKNEVRAVMKYVALEKAQPQQYAIDLLKDGKRSRVTMNGQGGDVKVTELRDDKPKEKADKPAANEKEIDIPEKAAKSVKAIKALYPDAAVKQITTEVFDDGSGEIEILTYEIEFTSKGVQREMVASPDGIIPHLWVTVPAKDLPKAVTDASDKAVPGARIESARVLEIRAGLRFGDRDKPKFYYTVQVEADGKAKSVKVKPDGSIIEDTKFPRKDR